MTHIRYLFLTSLIVAYALILRIGCAQDTDDESPLSNINPEGAPKSTLDRETQSGQRPAGRQVIVQLFNWPFAKITEEMALLAERGYGQIHVSPPNLTIDNDIWWGRYQPIDYRVIDGPLGDERSFKKMIDSAHTYGIKILVDLVLNHTANEDFIPTSPSHQSRQLILESGPLFTSQDYHPAACITDYNDPVQVVRNRLCGVPGDKGLPDLDHRSPRVLAAQKAFVAKLIALGVDGFRLDAVKHIEPTYFHKLFTPEQREKYYIFGEIITDPKSYDRDLGPYLKETSFSYYDFPLRATIQEAFRFGGRLGDLLAPDLVNTKRSLPWNRSVTFVMAHDIPNNDIFRNMIVDPVDEKLAYAYLLGRSEGVPYVFSDLGIAGGGGIREDRWAYAHRSPLLAKMIRFHNKVFGTTQQNLIATDCLVVFAREAKGLVAINKCGEDFEVNVDFLKTPSQTYYELMTETTITGGEKKGSKGGNLVIPGRSARMYIAQ